MLTHAQGKQVEDILQSLEDSEFLALLKSKSFITDDNVALQLRYFQNKFLLDLDSQIKPIDFKQPAHVELVNHVTTTLWNTCFPQVKLKTLGPQQYAALGFGSLHENNWAGINVLQLQNLGYFAEKYAQELRTMVLRQLTKRVGYNVCSIGSTVTEVILEEFPSSLDSPLLPYHVVPLFFELNRESFHDLFCVMFFAFDKKWEEAVNEGEELVWIDGVLGEIQTKMRNTLIKKPQTVTDLFDSLNVQYQSSKRSSDAAAESKNINDKTKLRKIFGNLTPTIKILMPTPKSSKKKKKDKDKVASLESDTSAMTSNDETFESLDNSDSEENSLADTPNSVTESPVPSQTSGLERKNKPPSAVESDYLTSYLNAHKEEYLQKELLIVQQIQQLQNVTKKIQKKSETIKLSSHISVYTRLDQVSS